MKRIEKYLNQMNTRPLLLKIRQSVIWVKKDRLTLDLQSFLRHHRTLLKLDAPYQLKCPELGISKMPGVVNEVRPMND